MLKINILAMVACFSLSLGYTPSDIKITIEQYVISNNFIFEEHFPVTQDGYILSLWHITKPHFRDRPPILLQHGLLDSGFTFMFKVWERTIVGALINAGYDVWIGNARGNIHSLDHINPTEYDWRWIWNKYWDFSLDELSLYDFPTQIDYISKYTGFEKVSYIGHSQGATQFLLKSIDDVNYVNNKIQAFIGFGPALVENPIKNAQKVDLKMGFNDFLYWLNVGNFFTIPSLMPYGSKFIEWFPDVLVWIVRAQCGETKNQTMDKSRLYLAALSEPGGTSSKNMVHWDQIDNNPGVSKFDYGKEGNIMKYGTETPPRYDIEKLKNVTVPILISVGKCDIQTLDPGLSELRRVLPSTHEYQDIDDYAHLDYLWADNAHIKVYPDIIKFLNKHKQ